MAPTDIELSRSFLAMLHTKEEKIRKLSERLAAQQQKLSQAEANAQHEMRDLLSTNRKLYLRMEEMRKEYHRVAADNVELRLALSRRDEVLTESRALMNDLQTRLKERGGHGAASESPAKRMEEKAAAKREAGAVHGTSHGERGVFNELTRPARVFGRKADRAAEARSALRELYVKRGEARDTEGGGENQRREVGEVGRKQAWVEEGVGDWQSDVEEMVGGRQEEEEDGVGGSQLLEEGGGRDSQPEETATVKEKRVTDASKADRRRERINVCAPSEKVPLSQTRPKRHAAPLSMVEPQLGTKLRQG
ncbi:hypothetical protein AB1Y20_008910 [Prymnesium parvum]|uniref:Cilia- and flagella-associated protein 157 n=1 Tax=Prymnesium parvum TaxID=97485 RepID=A0AB34K030_PRYPA